jgi:hypothetical protein
LNPSLGYIDRPCLKTATEKPKGPSLIEINSVFLWILSFLLVLPSRVIGCSCPSSSCPSVTHTPQSEVTHPFPFLTPHRSLELFEHPRLWCRQGSPSKGGPDCRAGEWRLYGPSSVHMDNLLPLPSSLGVCTPRPSPTGPSLWSQMFRRPRMGLSPTHWVSAGFMDRESLLAHEP